MNDQHNELIKSLSDDLDPIKPLYKQKRKTFIVLIFSYLSIFIGAALIGFRADIEMVVQKPEFLLQLFSLFCAGLFSVIASFRLMFPQEKVRTSTWGLIILSTLLLTGVTIYCAMMGHKPEMPIYFNWDEVFHRLKNVFLLSIIPMGIMIWTLKKGSSVHTSLIGYTSFMAVTCLSVIGCRLTCPIDSLFANLIWHYLPIIILSLLGYIIGRFIYRW